MNLHPVLHFYLIAFTVLGMVIRSILQRLENNMLGSPGLCLQVDTVMLLLFESSSASACSGFSVW
jgi:hypothetical protein